jgi:intraflagellar transport protein 46
MSKKLQYGDVVVRSIENANKNPVAIEKWIQSISDLHRSKPPPQVCLQSASSIVLHEYVICLDA